MSRLATWLTCLVACVLLSLGSAMRVSKIVEGDEFVFIEKFCFSDQGLGTLTGKVFANSKAENVMFVLFTDEAGGWEEVMRTESCYSRVADLAKMKIPIEENVNYHFDVRIKDEDGPHFWYLVAVSCGSRVNMSVDLRLLNSGSKVFSEFSNDEKGLLFVYLVMLVCVAALFYTQFRGARVYMASKSLHPIVQIVSVAIVLELVSLFLHSCHYVAYAHNGVGSSTMEMLAQIVYVLFQICMVSIIIILSKGWTISRIELTDRNMILGVLALYSLLHTIMFAWTIHSQFRPSTVYKYSTAPGMCIVIMRLALWGWFLYSLRATMMDENDPNKLRLYQYLGLSFSVWLTSLAVIVSIAATIEPCSRKALVTSIALLVDTLNLSLLAFLLWPSRASNYFQIEINPEYMEIAKKKDDNL